MAFIPRGGRRQAFARHGELLARTDPRRHQPRACGLQGPQHPAWAQRALSVARQCNCRRGNGRCRLCRFEPGHFPSHGRARDPDLDRAVANSARRHRSRSRAWWRKIGTRKVVGIAQRTAQPRAHDLRRRHSPVSVRKCRIPADHGRAVGDALAGDRDLDPVNLHFRSTIRGSGDRIPGRVESANLGPPTVAYAVLCRTGTALRDLRRHQRAVRGDRSAIARRHLRGSWVCWFR